MARAEAIGAGPLGGSRLEDVVCRLDLGVQCGQERLVANCPMPVDVGAAGALRTRDGEAVRSSGGRES